MIIGIGNDMVDIRRVEQTLEKFGDRFRDRIFSSSNPELADGPMEIDTDAEPSGHGGKDRL